MNTICLTLCAFCETVTNHPQWWDDEPYCEKCWNEAQARAEAAYEAYKENNK